MLEVARAHDIRFHHVSTDEVFGDLALEDPVRFREDSPYRPSSPYAASKASSDLLVCAWARTYGLPATISNCCNNYGPLQNEEKFIPAAIESVKRGKRRGRMVTAKMFVIGFTLMTMPVLYGPF